MSNLLNFNMNRELGFSPNRPFGFELNRPLTFDINRDLSFNPNRDLGFGKRGVLFRGYVCAACGAIVSADATSCDECGAVFEAPEEKGIMKAPPLSPLLSPEARATPPPQPTQWAAPPPPPSLGHPVPTPAMERSAPPAPQPPTFGGTPPPTPSTARFCPSCGARSWSGDAFCWNCGSRFTGASKPAAGAAAQGSGSPPTESISLPPLKAKKIAKDWSETGKTLSEYAEEEK
jgi:hypothetical protein